MRDMCKKIFLVKVLVGSILLYSSIWMYGVMKTLMMECQHVNLDATGSDLWPRTNDALEHRRQNLENESREQTSQTPYRRLQRLPKDETRYVILLTYQRGGSSFLGEIFNKNEDALYWFEPLDGAYSSLYGLKQGWAMPSDITNFPNGSVRIPNRHELQVTYNTLRGLLSCEFGMVPSDVLWHKFFTSFPNQMTNLQKYVTCIKKIHHEGTCRSSIAHICPVRLNGRPDMMEVCRQHIPWNYTAEGSMGRSVRSSADTAWLQDQTYEHIRMPENSTKQFNNFVSCQKAKRRKLFTMCIPTLQSVCNTSIRSIKTIRLTMDIIEDLIRDFPNVRIVHHYRDPRAVVRSRTFSIFFQSLYAGDDVVKEAKLYCQTLVRDIKLRRVLEKKYPNTFYETRYKELASDPVKVATEIYQFIDVDLPTTVTQWLRKSTSAAGRRSMTQRNATKTLQSWEKLSLTSVKRINKVCRDLYDLVPGMWPHTDIV